VIPALQATIARPAELLTARRDVGSARKTSFDVSLPSSRSGLAWPVRLSRSPDGTTEVTLAPQRDGAG
jgi:hypothetical protein